MHPTQTAATRHARRPILGFTATPAPRPAAHRETARLPAHDFLLPNLYPQFTPALAAPAARGAPGRPCRAA
jgi:hypothetical protein